MSESALDRPHLAVVTDDISLSHFLTEGLVYEGFWTSAIGSGLQFLEVLRLANIRRGNPRRRAGGYHGRRRSFAGCAGTSDRTEPGLPRSEMPAIVIAGIPGEIALSKVLAAGGQLLLEPPLEIDEVGAIVKQLLDQVGM